MCLPSRRANCIHELAINDSHFDNVLPAVVTATIFGSQCSSLTALYLVPAVVGLAGAEIAAVAALTQLRFFKVRCNATCCMILVFP